MDPASVVALVSSVLLLAGVIYTASRGSRSKDQEVAASAAASTLEQANQALEKAWEVRLAQRDEKITDLSGQLDAALTKIDDLTADVQRLTQMVISLGGKPDGS